jgi:hypothetical protein
MSIIKIVVIQVQSGESLCKSPAFAPMTSSKTETTALPKKTDKSIGAEKSHLDWGKVSCILGDKSAD